MTDLTSLWHFSRPKLAASLCARLVAGERVAMFGARQTGKTTLLREEVMPAAMACGALPIYIECWADKGKPLDSINYALNKALETLQLKPGRSAARLARTPVKKIGFATASVELGEVGNRTVPANPYLAFDALLTQLIEASGQRLVLIFDEFQAVAEAQDADGIAGALRSALTQASGHAGVVFSGSSQHLLLQMFSRAQTPLYNFANAEPYPLLKEDFVGHVAGRFLAATQRDMNQALALRMLETVGHQPAPFLNAVANAMSRPDWSLQDGLDAMLDPKVINKWSSAWLGLTDLQRVALRLVQADRPLTAAASLAWAAEALGMPKAQASSLSRAAESLAAQGLADRDHGSGRYRVQDPVMAAWLTRNSKLPCKLN